MDRVSLKLLLRKKQVIDETTLGLRRCLTALDVTLLGIGAIIGAGIFVITGIAAATKAGPAIVISYLLAGTACAFAALSYAELAASIGGCGSAYSYAYTGFGELVAWIIGWDLLLEYGISCSAVAIGWSGYVANILTALGSPLPVYLLKSPADGGIVNLPAIFIIIFLATLLAIGVRASTRFNTVMVLIKLCAITLFVFLAIGNININYLTPFMPFGWSGVVSGAALIFFAYIGFDAVSTAAAETINPQRNLPIGIIVSLVICTLIYILVSGLLILLVPYQDLNVASPVAEVLLRLGYRLGGAVVAAGAIAGLTTVILVMYFGFTRVFLAMAIDGLLPTGFAKVNKKTSTPVQLIILSGFVMSIIAGFAPIAHVAELVNIGTLAAFCLVCAGVIVLRYTHPYLPRPFKTPFSPITPILGIVLCFYLMIHLSFLTWSRFVVWMLIGIFIYFIYGYRHSKLHKRTSY